jgi:uncharacterized coiled-coil protein SlyX
LAKQTRGGLHLGIDDTAGDLGPNNGLEEGNGFLLTLLLDQQGPQGHACLGQKDQVLDPHRRINRITQSGFGEIGPTALEQLTRALEMAGCIHGETPTSRERTTRPVAGYPRSMDDESRFVELELRYMQQYELLQELSDVVYAQRRELDGLRAELDLLKKKLADEPGLVDARQQEKPPHY